MPDVRRQVLLAVKAKWLAAYFGLEAADLSKTRYDPLTDNVLVPVYAEVKEGVIEVEGQLAQGWMAMGWRPRGG